MILTLTLNRFNSKKERTAMIFSALKAGYQKVANALGKTGSRFGTALKGLFARGTVDAETLEQLEQLFFEADFGVALAQELTDKLKKRRAKALSVEELLTEVHNDLVAELQRYPSALRWANKGPTVVALVGVNGNGKTTSAAKLAKRWHDEGKGVLLAAADTYRAAAIEQLELWAERLAIPIVKGLPKSDPSAVVFDALSAGVARSSDVVIIDTAGRLHTKTPLMQELEKLKRTCAKVITGAPHETLLVLDANNGQNGIDQARTFHRYLPLTGLIVTKLDGRAKGGVVFQIQRELAIPIKFIGVGESPDDLQPFDAAAFCSALLA